MNIYLKTSNKHKQKEVENIFQGYGLNVSTISPSDLADFSNISCLFSQASLVSGVILIP